MKGGQERHWVKRFLQGHEGRIFERKGYMLTAPAQIKLNGGCFKGETSSIEAG